MGLFARDDFNNDFGNTKPQSIENEEEIKMGSDTLVVELALPNKAETEIRTYTGYDFVIDEDESILYVCADEDCSKVIVAFNLDFIVSYYNKNRNMDI